MSEQKWTQYRRTNVAEMRPYVPGESLDGISVSDVDSPPNDMGMIARNPKNHTDQWYVARQYFEDNFEPINAFEGIANPAAVRELVIAAQRLLDMGQTGESLESVRIRVDKAIAALDAEESR